MAILNIKGRAYDLTSRTLVMGILNVTPDSFSDGGRFLRLDEAVEQGLRLKDEGADIIDVGGESTRPGASVVAAAEEMARVLPIIQALSAATDIPISIDTYKPEVAKAALEAGATMLNDVWGGRRERAMLELAAEWGVPICLMHNRHEALYGDLMAEVAADLGASVALALAAGVRSENIILDPGIGFGKTAEHNLLLMRELSEIVALGYPVLLGTSRKAFIGKVLDLPVNDRLEGTAATVAYGITRGARMVRVHDVASMVRVARMTDALLRGGLAHEG
ncbi:MAG: dihydropteroate synthase [Firmicutes bacterium]|nr:dihydropteroate synthase [Dethiobacter sp.]MBS3888949.1 dihydropteroate synthase [Bacillota bacterium]